MSAIHHCANRGARPHLFSWRGEEAQPAEELGSGRAPLPGEGTQLVRERVERVGPGRASARVEQAKWERRTNG